MDIENKGGGETPPHAMVVENEIRPPHAMEVEDERKEGLLLML